VTNPRGAVGGRAALPLQLDVAKRFIGHMTAVFNNPVVLIVSSFEQICNDLTNFSNVWLT